MMHVVFYLIHCVQFHSLSCNFPSCCDKDHQSYFPLTFSSGAEDHCAHVWDRHFGAKLATLKGHSNVVNCVAFNPVNQEMVVSASDDHTIRVWKSRHLSKLYDEADLEKQSGEVSSFYEDIYRETTV